MIKIFVFTENFAVEGGLILTGNSNYFFNYKYIIIKRRNFGNRVRVRRKILQFYDVKTPFVWLANHDYTIIHFFKNIN